MTGLSAFRPIRTLAVDLCEPLPKIHAHREGGGEPWGSARVLVRVRHHPIGIVQVDLPPDGLDPDALAVLLWDAKREEIMRLASANGLSATRLDPVGLGEPTSGEIRSRAAALSGSKPAAVILCTRERPGHLRECLQALALQEHPNYEVLVVDNAPVTNATSSIVDEFRGQMQVRRVVEPLPGLSRARNAGIRHTCADLVAFLDDDEIADSKWLAELTLAFTESDDVGCATGMILPASLETRAQAWFEEYGGHSKNRGFEQRVFAANDPVSQHALYPLPPFGAGGNMAFSRDALLAIKGFDPALGAGTATRGAEDTAAFAEVMLKGYRLVYRPSAFLWHNHYQDFADLEKQLFGYGSGLTTYFVRILMRHPRLAGELLKLVPRGVRDLLGRDSQRFATMDTSFPRELLAAHRRGMVSGLTAYPRTVWSQRRVPSIPLDLA